jgi:hypothetical protein
VSVRNPKVSLEGHDDLTRLAGRMLEALTERFPEECEKLSVFLTIESETQAGTAAQTGSTDAREVLSSVVAMHVRGLQAMANMNPALIAPIREWLMETFGH